MTAYRGRIRFKLTNDALIVANTGKPFTLRGLEAVVYGWTTTKAENPDLELPADRPFRDETDAEHEVIRLYRDKQRALSIPNELAAQITQQAQTAQSYAGRALLELLQNAVDANRDTPIGYKGVGFRAILKLTEAPEIHSGPLHVHWSPQICRRALNGAAAPPSIVLAFPEWCAERLEETAKFSTTIKLPLSPDKRADLLKEWNETTSDPSLLAFIDGVQEVRWESTTAPTKVWQREHDGDLVLVTETIGDSTPVTGRWRLHSSASGAATVAVLENSDGRFAPPPAAWAGKLRAFFPTEDSNPFPSFLVHAEFPLTPDRKHIDAEHDDFGKRIDEVVEAVVSAIGERAAADVLDLLAHAAVNPTRVKELDARLTEAVRVGVRQHPIAQLRCCPEPRLLPSAFWWNNSHFEGWEKFKHCLADFRRGLDGLGLLPIGIENKPREETLLWLNRNGRLTKEDLRTLPWAPVEGSSEPATSSSPPLFKLPDDELPVPLIPTGIRLNFLDLAFQKAMGERFGVKVADSFLHETLGVLPFTLLDVVERAILPAITDDPHPEATVEFLHALWLRAGKERDKPFDWTDARRAKLIFKCRMVCRGNTLQPVLKVYAGSDWTNSDYLERVYDSHTGHAFLHPPPEDETKRAELESFYRWLGVGWSPKALPLVKEPDEKATKPGLLWGEGRFVGLTPQPPGWSDYCKDVWIAGYERERFVERTPRMKSDWQLDGGAEVLRTPGAFDVIRGNWAYYESYTRSVCSWSSDLSKDYDNTPRNADSYLCWILKQTAWIPSDDPARLDAPCDVFLQRSEVAQTHKIRGWVHELKADVPREMAKALGFRANFSEVIESDWRRWLDAASRKTPQETIEDRKPIQQLYSCLLEHTEANAGAAHPFAKAKVWWVERTEKRDSWKCASVFEFRGSYLDRPEYASLHLPGVFVFPAWLDGKEAKAEALFGMPKLSARLKGEPVLTEASEIVALRDLIKQRTPFLIAYLGLDGGEQRRAKIKAAIQRVSVYEVGSLHVQWKLDERALAVPSTEEASFTHHTESGWRLYLVTRDRQQRQEWDRERLAQTLLLACGLLPTREAANVRDILTFDDDHLDEKLTGLGVAPETVEAAIAEAAEFRAVALEEPGIGRFTPPPTPAELPPQPPVSPEPKPPTVAPTEPVVTPPHFGGIPPGSPSMVPRQRDHTGAFDAQEWLRAELKSLVQVASWQVSDGERIIGQSRIDIVLSGPSEPYLIEVKQIERGKVYWRQEQIETAQQQHPGRLRERETDLQQYRKQGEDLTKQLDHPFEHEEKLTTATKRQQEIITALDITKNQAAATVADSPEENADTIEEKTTEKTAEKIGRKKTRPVTI